MLVRAHGHLVKALRCGVVAADAVAHVERCLRQWAPQLLPHLTRSLGHGMATTFRVPGLSLAAGCDARLATGHVLSVALGFANVPLDMGPVAMPSSEKADGNGGPAAAPESTAAAGTRVHTGATYSLFIADTVVIDAPSAGAGSSILTVLPGSSSKLTAWIPSFAQQHASAQAAAGPGAEDVGRVLPVELLARIFAQLDAFSLAQASRVCRHWSRVPWHTLDFGRSFNRIRQSVPQMDLQGMRHSSGRSVRYQLVPSTASARKIHIVRSLRVPRCMDLRRLSLAGLELAGQELGALSRLPHLEELDVSGMRLLGDGAGAALGALLSTPHCRLRALWAAAAWFGTSGIVEIARALEKVCAVDSVGVGRRNCKRSLWARGRRHVQSCYSMFCDGYQATTSDVKARANRFSDGYW